MSNYYEILGLDKNCTDNDIKKAYRKMSMKWHPDKWINATEEEKKTAENKFRECTEAYEILSNNEKRRNYDEYGDPNGRPNFFGGLDDLFNGFASSFNMGFSNRLTIKLIISVSELYEKMVNHTKANCIYEAKRKCDKCNGSGIQTGGSKITCSTCGGRGMMIKREQLGNGLIVERKVVCPSCHGKGYTIDKPCEHCHGEGLKNVEISTIIDIPYGVQNNSSFIYPNCGNEDENGNIGDLMVVFDVQDDDYVILNSYGDVMTRTLDIPILTCIIGGKIEVTAPDNKKYFCGIPQGIKDGEKIRMKNKGLPNGNGFGSLIIPINVVMPTHIDEKEKKIIEKLLKSKNFQL